LRTSREQILAVASQLYLEQGAKGISMRKIASVIGITPMALYRHFENKDELQCALLKQSFVTFGEYLYPSLQEDSPEQRFHRCVRGYFEFAREQRNYFGLIFLATNPLDSPGIPAVIEKESAPPFRFLMDRVRECMDAGYFKRGDVYDCAITLLAQTTGMASLYLSNSIQMGDDKAWSQYEKAMQMVLTGILAD
jgi:AcrR family transcriptional regulator